jgi:hypothetical protein
MDAWMLSVYTCVIKPHALWTQQQAVPTKRFVDMSDNESEGGHSQGNANLSRVRRAAMPEQYYRGNMPAVEWDQHTAAKRTKVCLGDFPPKRWLLAACIFCRIPATAVIFDQWHSGASSHACLSHTFVV